MKVARDRMFARASMENIIPDFQANLGDALAKIALDVERPDANKTDEEKEKKLASEIEAIIRAVKKGGESLALAASASPTQRKIQSTLGDLTRVYWEKANELSNPVGTGIAGLDRVMSGGLHAGRLLVLLAGPGGKDKPCQPDRRTCVMEGASGCLCVNRRGYRYATGQNAGTAGPN